MKDARAQTTLDYAIGVGVFMLTLVAVVAFVPSLFQPFVGPQEDTRIADRAASQLSTDVFGTPSKPYVLDEACTREYFDADGAVGSCRFSVDASSPKATLNLASAVHFNVTIEDAAGVVTTDGVDLRAGPVAPSGTQSVTVAQRSVLYGTETYRLYVRVW